MATTSVETVCGYCGVGCGLTLTAEAGPDGSRVLSSTGTGDHPANRGRLCTKGNTTADLLNAGGRQTRALVDGGPRPVDDAVAEAARRFAAVWEEHGDDAVAFYVSGQMSLESQYLANKLAKGYFRTNFIESNSRLCMASAATGYKQSLGADGPPGSYDDLDHADVFLVTGANMADCHPILFLRMMDRVKAGAKLIVVDPRRTATAKKADLHLPVRPGTDMALLNGLLRLIVDSGQVDCEFIDGYTEGWEDIPGHLSDYPVETVAEITGLSEEDLRRAAEWIGSTQKFVSMWTMGLNQSVHGTWHTTALCNLHLATGAICRPGAGPLSLTGQPNAMGGREMGYMGPGLPGQRTVLDADQRAEVEEIWDLPAGTLHDRCGSGTVDLFRDLADEDGTVKALWVICSNPASSMANGNAVAEALDAADCVVVQDAYAGTATAGHADIVLPAALWSEADGVMVNSERNLTLTSPLLDSPGDALPDWELICRVARAMGFAGFDFATASEVFDEIRRFHNPRTGWDLRGVDHERLRQGPVQWPAAPGAGERNPVRYLNDGVSQDLFVTGSGEVPRLAFPTPTRRARFHARPWLPPAETPDDEFPLVLTTGRLPHQWHTMTKTGRVNKLMKLNPSSFVQIHPVDAAGLGVADGDPVEVRSRRGAVSAPALVSEDIVPGTCFIPMHFADTPVNEVTSDAVDPESLQPEFKACAVALTAVPVPAAVPEENAVPNRQDLPDMPDLPTVLAAAPTADWTVAERAWLDGMVHALTLAPPTDAVPTVPAHAPLTEPHRAWVDGVLSGLFARVPLAVSPASAPEQHPGQSPVTVVWASQTGTVEEYVPDLVAALTASGIPAQERCADSVTPAELTGTVLFVVASTGDGEAPDNATALWDSLSQQSELDDLRCAVLGFGDSSYADFCGFARRLEERLTGLGAQLLAPRGSCEPDFEDAAAAWLAAVSEELADGDVAPATPTPASPTWSRKNPLPTRLLESTRLTSGDPVSTGREVRRYAFELPADTLTYSAGDALGIWPRNRSAVVEEFLARTGLNSSATDDLINTLTGELDITAITPAVLRLIHAQHPGSGLGSLTDDPAALREYAHGRQLCDVLASYPVTVPAESWLEVLSPLRPRLYSISSSPLSDPGRVEITVSTVGFTSTEGHRRRGVSSGWLADLASGDEVRLFISPNRSFGPPEQADAPMIMIGPGTGIAPFRGFLQDRRHAGATGENWLFYGERHEATDFLYREELNGLRNDGTLTRLSTAFSRDTSERVYVQDRMRRHARELWEWIGRGAHLYVCGDAARMATDVDRTLRQIVAEQGAMDETAAGEFIAQLSAEKRYVRDVY
ncbi:bifunctional nitrate reductase/sulfite reductase flavoprotein subunit alpha [Corynebacterium variabile]|uniref:bifunctional nitrate reductase/sulfite reductase flavoprotein subunit alpha n=1 Tax=Corynebacterium variabile TaxID=1727 RepID=UPI00289E23D3|nr:bifunctional nitrate reductase/sulfite reductase flavoprotein subunit alpha [Corynebacterium variabile]